MRDVHRIGDADFFVVGDAGRFDLRAVRSVGRVPIPRGGVRVSAMFAVVVALPSRCLISWGAGTHCREFDAVG